MTKFENHNVTKCNINPTKRKRTPTELRTIKIQKANRATAERLRLIKVKEKLELRLQKVIDREEKCLDSVARHDKRYVNEHVDN